MTRPLLLLLGDSLTQFGSNWRLDGWICLLLDRFNRFVDIAQRGLGSYTTQSFINLVVATLARDLETTLRPQLITLWLGANDTALLEDPSPEVHVPLDTYKSNLHEMLALFKQKAPQAKVLLITPGAVDDDARRVGWSGYLDRSNAAAGEYARACVEVAHEAEVEVLDLHTIFNGATISWKNHSRTRPHTFPELQAHLETVEFPLSELATVAPDLKSLTHESFTWIRSFENETQLRLHTVVRTSFAAVDDEIHAIALLCVALLALVAWRVYHKLHGTAFRTNGDDERANLLNQ